MGGHTPCLPFTVLGCFAGLGLCTSKKWSSSSPDAAPRPFSVASKPIVEGYGYLFGICSRCTRIMTFASLQNESSWNFFKMFSIVYYCFVIVRWGRWAFRKLRCIFHQCWRMFIGIRLCSLENIKIIIWCKTGADWMKAAIGIPVHFSFETFVFSDLKNLSPRPKYIFFGIHFFRIQETLSPASPKYNFFRLNISTNFAWSTPSWPIFFYRER